jgi:hypothetical protein
MGFDVKYFEKQLKAAQEKCLSKAPNIKSSHRKGFVEACELFHDGFELGKKAESEKEIEKAASAQQKGMKKSVKAAHKIFENLEMVENSTLETAAMKGAILMHATPEGLAKFCEENKKHEKLIDHLLGAPALMKEMLTNGGAAKGNYGQAMKIYTKILSTFPILDDAFSDMNRKIAMAVALELASPINEFDTKVEVNPQKRYTHFSEAYKNGELDPAFPHFSIWEMRHIVNCDAPNDQLKWARDMMMNYSPYITAITDEKKKYLYILDTDVLTRNPTWTSDPRTYQQVLSGGGKDAPNAWFGRFILNAFGIPTWGCKQPGRVGMTRWTPAGWEAMLGADWDVCEWEGETGIDFKGEVDVRSAHTSEEYFQKLVLLECVAEVLEGRHGEIPEEEKTILHPNRLWRSLAIIQKALMLAPCSPENFERKGRGGVKTNVEKYLEMYEKDEDDSETKQKGGKVTIPAGAHGYNDGTMMLITSFSGGKQLNFISSGTVDFDLPDDIEDKEWNLTLEVCTVHLKQAPLMFSVDLGEKISIEVPYTVGEWQKTKPIKVELSGGQAIRFQREGPCFGIAIKKIILS